ncbi:hypothetical protein JX265_004766 [Neoarthrinium moseri]|uniref:Uncharacterized protein n=1 Tax=Neoarthrinium moseri TaxID=1658444 RepID=A0A9P9WQ52_9PEZI|nr:hypothetical protein JX265_004766 [Neoarthrinium moseri]
MLFIIFNQIIHKGSPCGGEARWSPAEEVIEYEDRRLEAFLDMTPFAGEPSPQIDAAWSELMEGINIKIRPEEMSRLEMSSVGFRDGSGYVGTLSVYHELHCVKMIRQWFYQSHYFSNISDQERINKHSHVVIWGTEHCIEELRVAVACHGDTSVIPHYWLHETDQKSSILGITLRDDEPKHRCVKWNKLHMWALSRRVDIANLDLFMPEHQ